MKPILTTWNGSLLLLRRWSRNPDLTTGMGSKRLAFRRTVDSITHSTLPSCKRKHNLNSFWYIEYAAKFRPVLAFMVYKRQARATLS